MLKAEVQSVGPGELDIDFIIHEVKETILGMRNANETVYCGIPAEVWKVLVTKDEGIEL
jgi:hypothetical protein